MTQWSAPVVGSINWQHLLTGQNAHLAGPGALKQPRGVRLGRSKSKEREKDEHGGEERMVAGKLTSSNVPFPMSTRGRGQEYQLTVHCQWDREGI
jgi:hypothetical protein